MSTERKSLVIAIYSHPEYYPPTLNAIEYLSAAFDDIYVVHRNITGFDWKYPANVHLIAQKKLLPVREAEKAGLLRKIGWFIKFSLFFFSMIRKTRANAILVYDCMPLLSLRLLYPVIKKPAVLWYHNHDVSEQRYLKKWSLAWWAWKSEKWVFPRLTLFTLPAMERKECFPMGSLRGSFFFLPNYPAVKVYDRFRVPRVSGQQISLLYQGSIGPQHGLEEIIELLEKKILGRDLHLVLKGFISQEYLQELKTLAEKYNAGSRLVYIGPGGYSSVITNAANCHIGIGIHKKEDMMNKTLGTASNKIYEYAAIGLPVILYDNNHFKSYLSKFNWAFFTDCSEASLTACLEEIISNYELYSGSAVNSFKESLNFEHFFLPVLNSVNRQTKGLSNA